jgi:hypothetical protein
MGRYADQKKKEGLFFQYRVINKDGAALLQTKEKKRDSYRDRTVSEHQLSAFQKAPRAQHIETPQTSKNPPPQLPSSTSTSNQSNSNQQQTNNSRPASSQSGAAGQLPTATLDQEEYYKNEYHKQLAIQQQLADFADTQLKAQLKMERTNWEIPMNG